LNHSLKYYFTLARSKESHYLNILQDLKYFLRSHGISDATLALEDEHDLSAEEALKLETFFSSYLSGIPLDYILNESEFMGYKFYVDPRVLIPRPETELIVEWVLDLSFKKNSTILEVGTGSGCIAISICLKNKNLKILATDISDKALEVAILNREKHHANNVTLVQSNWMSCVAKNSLDVIISNPPYLKSNDAHLANLKHEPLIALTSDKGSQSFYEIASQGIYSLKPGGKIIFEHGYSQAEEVLNILNDFGYKNIISKQDLQGLDRYIYANK